MIKLATLCYLKDGQNTLMLHRVKKDADMHLGKWNGLGGKLENGETPEACAVREVYEESGLVVSNPQLKGFITFPNFDGQNDWYVFVYRFDDYEGELIDSSEGNLEWIPDVKMSELPLWDGDRIFMKWLDQSKLFSAVFNYEAGTLLDWSVTWY
ncbi:8-oxo-dGTP diphosphatase [bacterium]|nr:8-oxo-dGTP diphosphatase [bacterium]